MKSATMGIYKRIENLFHYVDAGEVRAATVSKIMDEWESTLKKTLARIPDWRQRLEAMTHNGLAPKD